MYVGVCPWLVSRSTRDGSLREWGTCTQWATKGQTVYWKTGCHCNNQHRSLLTTKTDHPCTTRHKPSSRGTACVISDVDMHRWDFYQWDGMARYGRTTATYHITSHHITTRRHFVLISLSFHFYLDYSGVLLPPMPPTFTPSPTLVTTSSLVLTGGRRVVFVHHPLAALRIDKPRREPLETRKNRPPPRRRTLLEPAVTGQFEGVRADAGVELRKRLSPGGATAPPRRRD